MDRIFWTVCACAAAIMGSYALQLAVMPVDMHAIGFVAFDTGLILAGFPVGIILYRVAGATWIDRTSWRLPIIAGSITAALGCAIGGYAIASPAASAASGLFGTTGLALGLSRVLLGIGFSAVTASTIGCVGYRSPRERRGAFMGVYFSITALAMVIGPPAGLLILNRAGLGAAYCATVASALLAGLLGASIAGAPQQTPKSAVLAFKPAHVGLILAAGLCAFPVGAQESTLPYLANARHITNLPVIYLVWGLAVASGRLAGGRLSDRLGAGMIVRAGLLAGAAGQLWAAAMPGQWPLMLASLLGGVGLGLASTSLSAALSLSTPPGGQGRMLSLTQLAYNTTFAGAAAIGGLSFAFSPIGPFAVSLVSLLLALAIALPSSRGARVAPQQVPG